MDPQTSLGAGELEALFKFIPSLQLLELRKASKVLNVAAIPVLRKRLDLNFTLTEEYSRSLAFWKFLQNLPENGFVASVMKLNISGKWVFAPKGNAVCWETGDVFCPHSILIEICKTFGTGNGPPIRKFILQTTINSEFQLLIIRYLSPSLEILDMEPGFLYFGPRVELRYQMPLNELNFISAEGIPETDELKLELFRNRFPLNNLKTIKVPEYRSKREQKSIIQWLGILVQSAPNLTHDPLAECRSEYGLSADDDNDNFMVSVANVVLKPPQEEDPMLDWNLDEDLLVDRANTAKDLSPQLGTDELEFLCKFIPSSQLLELRRVSKVWNEAALPVLRKRHDPKFTLTEDARRNWNFLKFLRNLPENGFLPSEMKVRGVNERECCVVDLERGFVATPLEIWIDICKLFAPGGRTIRKLSFEFGNSFVMRSGVITSEIMLLMLRHLSTSLEVLDLEWGFLDFHLPQEGLDEALDLFKNIPFNKLKMIMPPSNLIERYECEENDLIRWLSILVQSAPNLTNDPVAECKVDPSEYYHTDESDNYYSDTDESDDDSWEDIPDSSDDE